MANEQISIPMGPVIDLALNGDRTTPVRYAFVLLTRSGDKVEYTTNTTIDDVVAACEGLARALETGKNRQAADRLHTEERRPLELIGEAVRDSFKGDFALISFGVYAGPAKVEYTTNTDHLSLITMCKSVAGSLVDMQERAAKSRAFAAVTLVKQ